MALSRLLVGAALAAAVDAQDPKWGCGLVGAIPGIGKDGSVTPDTQKFIDGIKRSSSFNKAHYWNWDFVTRTTEGTPQYLSKDFIFMPESWGAGVVKADQLQTARSAGFTDGDGHRSPAQMADILLGMNEPDMYGSCMGNMMGKCTAPCTASEVSNCPAAHLSGSPAEPLPNGHCNCWQYSHATGVGFWGLNGCKAPQPLPDLWKSNDTGCVNTVIQNWKQTAAAAVSKGYKYLSTPLIAVDMDYARNFIRAACASCHDISCGCPVYVAFHFYAYDCQPEKGDYDSFQSKLDAVASIMEDYPFVKGAIINEVGMLNCARGQSCIPNSGRYPASKVPDHGCPATPSLPNGLATYLSKVMDMAIGARTKDGRAVVSSFSWFSMNMDGATYNLQFWDEAGKLNALGEAYIASCSKWAVHWATEVIV